MPFIHLRTNATVLRAVRSIIISEFGEAINNVPGKNDSWLMIDIDERPYLFFQLEDYPAAMIEVSMYGEEPEKSVLRKLTDALTDVMVRRVEIPSDRVYVKYTFTKHWGWNGKNF